jgi:hypothetical protein
VKVIIPGYIPPEFEVRDVIADEDPRFGPGYSINYFGLNNQCFSFQAASGGLGAAPAEIELVSANSKALGSVELEYTKFDASYNGSKIFLLQKGVIAAPQGYLFISPTDNNCQAIDIQEAVNVVESLIYLNP